MHQDLLDLPLRVLLIEDSPEDRALYRHFMNQDPGRSYQFEEAELGGKGLELCLANPPDVILLDYILPDLNGVEFLSALTTKLKVLPCPVIVVTGQGNENIAVECMKHGAHNYLVKQTLTQQLLHKAIHNALLDFRHNIREQYLLSSQILESISDGFYALDKEERFIYVNQLIELQSGMRREEMLGKKLLEVFPLFETLPVYARIHQALLRQETTRFESFLELSQSWAKISIYPVGGGITVYFQDITVRKEAEAQLKRWNEVLEQQVKERTASLTAEVEERKRAEAELSKTQELYRSVLEAMAEGVMVLEMAGACITANPSAERILGLTANQIEGRDAFDPRWQSIHEDGTPFPGESHPVTITLQTGQPCLGVKMGVHQPEGTLKWLSINTQPIFESDGVTQRGVVASFSDITEQEQAQLRLRESEEQYRLLFNNALYGVFLGQLDGKILAANKAGCRMLGYEKDEIVGLMRPQIVDLAGTDIWFDVEQLRRDKQIQWEGQLIHKDGSRIQVEVATSLYLDRQGQERLCVVTHDIGERKRMEEALGESEQRFRIAQENSLDVFGILKSIRDEQGQITAFEVFYANPLAAEYIGKPVEELPGRCISPDSTSGTITRLFEHYKAVVETAEPFNDEFKLEYSGKTTWFWFSVVKLGDGVAITAREITQQKEAEAKLRRQEQEFRALVENSPDMILRTDLGLGVLYVNPAFVRFSGVGLERVVGKATPATPEHLGIRNKLLELRDKLRKSGLPQVAEIELVAASGTKTYLDFRMVPELNAAGQPESLLIIARDLTELKQAQNELLERERFRALYELSPDAVALTDSEGHLVSCNPAMAALTGVPFERMRGHTPNELGLVALEQEVAWLKAANSYLHGAEPLTWELELLRAGQFPVTIEIRALMVMLDEKPHFICTWRDITKRKELENELRRALEQQRELAEMKDRFIQTTSHEFRTPLTIIQAIGESFDLYLERMNEEQIRDRVAKIKFQIKHFTRLLDDLLAYNLVQQKTVAPKLIKGDLVQSAQQFIQEMVEVDNGTHRFQLMLPEAPLETSFDPLLVRQIFTALLSNAMKYSGQGSEIEVELKVGDQGAVIRVADQGIGIPLRDQAQIGETFYRGSNVKTIQGTGMGLAILKEELELVGGEISFMRREGGGSTFTVSLPLIQ